MGVKKISRTISRKSNRAAQKITTSARVFGARSKPHLKKAAAKTHVATKKVTKTTVHHTKRVAKKVHKHVAAAPHAYLVSRVMWYRRWHDWRFHKHTHIVIFSAYSAVIILMVFFAYRATFAAPDLTSTWDFSNPSDYTLDSGVEIDSGVARLKAQNYTSDSNTSALFHFDESNGTTATDSSSNSNNATANESLTFSQGSLNNGVTLDGVDDLLQVNDSSSLSFNFANTLEGWTKFDTSFANNTHDSDQTILDKGSYKLYYDHTSGKINYEMADAGAATWNKVGGDDLNNGWNLGHPTACAQANDGTNVYVALCGHGTGASGGEVWRWNGSTWTKIGGQGVNSSWSSSIYGVTSLLFANGKLYAGTGDNDNLAELWEWNGLSWTKIGGGSTSVNGSWPANVELVASMTYTNGKLYAGLGRGANDARVYEWNGSSWTWVGGFGVSGYTAFPTGYETVLSLAGNGSTVYAALGTGTGEADLYSLSGTTWTQIGGDGTDSSWAASTYEGVYSMVYQGSTLYVGLGASGGDAEVWSLSGGTWTKIGGDSTNSGWTTGYEYVASMTGDGTNIYVGLGLSANDDEVWKWNGSSWSQIGGDGANGGFDNVNTNHSTVNSLTFMSGVLYVGLGADGGDIWKWNGSSWSQIGGDGVNNSWGIYRLQSGAESGVTYNGKLYTGTGINIAGNATVWEFDGSSWVMVGGQGLRGSWGVDTHETVFSMTVYKGELYAGLGWNTGDADVWKYNGSTWTQVGSDGLNSGWTGTYEQVFSLATYNGNLYAGLGNSNSDADVWRWNGSSWTQVGGDSLNSGWAAGIDSVESLTVYNGSLCAGLGAGNGEAEVWCYNGTSWSKIGGDAVNSSWADLTYERVKSLIMYNGMLCAGLGASTGDAEVWCYDGSAWAQIGGDGLNSGWSVAEQVNAMTVYNGNLFIGMGTAGVYSNVWRYNGSSWTQVGGGSVNLSWNTTVENVRSLTVHAGKLYAGIGDGSDDAEVWAYGNNAFLSSTTAAQDTSWHHIAATYDGTDMKIFIDGAQDASRAVSNLMPDTSHKLVIGRGYGSNTAGNTDGYFKGQLDEVRLSKTARTSFTIQPYKSTAQLITLNDPVYESGIKQWDIFDTVEVPDGGSVTYRLSADGGDTWLYYNGSDWVESADETQSNTESEVDAAFVEFPVTFYGFKWQAILDGNGYQRVGLSDVTAEATSDNNPPATNATNIVALKAAGGSSLADGDWTNGASPYFSWDAATDADSGVKGYCLYLGQDNTADPVSTAGLLGPSPAYAGSACEFLVEDNEVDFGTSGYIQTALSTSNSPYYLRIKAIDRAGNVIGSAASFSFRYDGQTPTNPAFVSAPAGFVTEKAFAITWPTTGGNAPSDANSGIAGLQYRINGSSWYGDSHTGTGNSDDLLSNDGSYTTQDPPDFDNIIDGVNTIYFRTWDAAGNVTTSYTTATVRVNTTGAPSEPQNVDVSPDTNTSNSFSFSWDAPANFVGEESNLTYCYTINTLPSSGTCTFTSAGVTSLGAGPYANQPGENTFYVVARDEANTINYSSYTSVEFTATTPSPGIPTNVDVVDVSVKATSNWRLALTWDVPTNVGAGISSYRVYRSTDNTVFTQIGSSASSTFIDSGLSQQQYYYRIRACDNTNNCGANSTTVNDTPTGRFTEPANEVASPVISNITTKQATISWSTDRESDSRIALGTSSGDYSPSEVTVSDQVTDHEVQLDNLRAGTTYYFIAKWTDEDGNTGQSQEYTFETSPAPSLKEIETTRVSLSTALITFTSRNAVRASILYGPTESFGGVKKVNTSSSESTYNVELEGLEDGTKYYYKVVTYDAEGTAYDGSIFSFTTPARPRISNLQFQPIKGEPTSTQKVTWDTNVPANSMITYGKLNTNGRDILESKLTQKHEIIIRDLEDSSEYFLIAQSRDANGVVAVSDRQTFETALDTRPPGISDVQVETSIRGVGADARGQIIVSWKTDEPATSQVAYNEGSDPSVFNNRTTEDSELSTEHVVIISDLPTSRVYSVQPTSADNANNRTAGPTESTIIGRATEGVLSIVLFTLQRIFGL